ncbi:unnamed protein product [Protopolystoma xenopodis]|uniref:Uncharacterized protein n=1 Tax=Protopolystoma xenopodis TaxID=117903 RepID=A0A448WWL4_9PLAT|nr:unnamed protein product [Protopolystoma xenopodis]
MRFDPFSIPESLVRIFLFIGFKLISTSAVASLLDASLLQHIMSTSDAFSPANRGSYVSAEFSQSFLALTAILREGVSNETLPDNALTNIVRSCHFGFSQSSDHEDSTQSTTACLMVSKFPFDSNSTLRATDLRYD